jgi:hypothetical protein
MDNTSSELIASFDDCIKKYLCPFMLSEGAKHSSGKSNFDGNETPSSLSSAPYDSVGNSFFWWINRFETDRCTLDISYGDREFMVETTLYYKGIDDRFGVWEIKMGAEIPEPTSASGASFVLSTEFMDKVISELSEGIKSNWKLISSPSNEVIDRTRVLRGKRMIFAQEEQRKKDREKACVQASTAFHNGEFKKAIQLLEPFEKDEGLAPSSAKLLTMAKHKTGRTRNWSLLGKRRSS